MRVRTPRSSFDPPPMPSGDGKPHTLTLTCRDCVWSTHGNPVKVVSAAVRHAEETGHGIKYRGIVQQFSGVKDASRTP